MRCVGRSSANRGILSRYVLRFETLRCVFRNTVSGWDKRCFWQKENGEQMAFMIDYNISCDEPKSVHAKTSSHNRHPVLDYWAGYVWQVLSRLTPKAFYLMCLTAATCAACDNSATSQLLSMITKGHRTTRPSLPILFASLTGNTRASPFTFLHPRRTNCAWYSGMPKSSAGCGHFASSDTYATLLPISNRSLHNDKI